MRLRGVRRREQRRGAVHPSGPEKGKGAGGFFNRGSMGNVDVEGHGFTGLQRECVCPFALKISQAVSDTASGLLSFPKEIVFGGLV